MIVSRKHKIITISPSGNLYGSENVLFDYLCATDLSHIVFVPRNSKLERKLQFKGLKHLILGYNPKRLVFFYSYLIVFVLVNRIKSVYINEAGHYKWIQFIARYLTKVKFTVHLRMIHDARIARIGYKIPKNLKLVSISNYVAQELIKNKVEVEVIYDGFDCQHLDFKAILTDNTIFQIGIIGRISHSKGIPILPKIIHELDKQNEINNFSFNLFGELMLNEGKDIFDSEPSWYRGHIHLKGFKPTNEIYQNTHVVLHLSKEEGLGRIFLEAICFKKPFVGFYSSGLKEIADLTGLVDTMVELNPDVKINAESIARKLIKLRSNYTYYSDKLNPCKDLYPFSIIKYSSHIDSILN